MTVLLLFLEIKKDGLISLKQQKFQSCRDFESAAVQGSEITIRKSLPYM